MSHTKQKQKQGKITINRASAYNRRDNRTSGTETTIAIILPFGCSTVQRESLILSIVHDTSS